jgi:hypothetical protein
MATLLSAGALATTIPVEAGAVPRPPGPSCAKPLVVTLEDLPPGAHAAIVLTGPGRYRQLLGASGSVCLTSAGDYALVARPITFRNPLGHPWHAYPSTPRGALPAERVAVTVGQALAPTPAQVSVSYFDQAPLTTFVVPRALVLVPSGRFLPTFGGFQVRKVPFTARIRPGDVVVSPVGPGLPHGLLGTVTQAQSLVNGIALRTVAVSPIRAFSQGHLTVSAARAAPAVRDLGGLSSGLARVPRQRLSPTGSVGFGCGQSLTVSGSASFQPSASLNLGWSWGPWYAPWQVEMSGNFSLDPGVSGSLTVSANDGIHCQVSVNRGDPVPIGSVWTEFGWFTFNLLATASLGGTVGEKFSQTLNEALTGGVGASFSFGYNGNSFNGTNTLDLTGSSTASSAWQGSVGVGIGPSLQVLYGIPDVAGVGPQVGVQDQLSLNADPSGFNVQAGADASVGIAMSALGFSYSDSVSVPLPGSPITLVQQPWSQLFPDPSPPLEVAATPDRKNTELDVSWQPPVWGGCGLTGYTVSAPGASPVNTSSTTATLTGLQPATSYTVTVQANTSCGGTSQATAAATTAPLTPPGPPTLTSVTTAGGWGRPGGWATFQPPAPCTGCSPVTGYVVNWSGDGTTGTDSVPGSPDGFFLPAYGTPYTVTVSATSSSGNGPPSNTVTFTPTSPPSVPLDLKVTAGRLVSGGYDGPAATVTWAPPASDGGLPITSYRIGWTGGQFDQPASDGTTATIKLPAYGAPYSFLVIAFNSLGNGPASPPVAATALAIPTAPTGVSATASTGSTLNVTWGPPSSDGGTPVTSYQVDWAGQGTWGEATEPGSAATAPVQLPAPGVYQVSVFATNSLGEGPPSSPVCVTVGTSAPCAPTITSASAVGNFGLTARISWTGPGDQGSTAVTSYTVAWTGPSGSSGSLLQPASAGTTATFTLLGYGPYSVVVSATNSAGTGPASAAATFTAEVPPPPPPCGPGKKCPVR